MAKYRRLTREERYQIEALLRSGLGFREISRQLARAPSTICREVKGNSYSASRADKWSQTTRRLPHPELRKIQGSLERYIRQKIRVDWSPEQISGKLRLDGKSDLSHQTIYRYIQRDRLSAGKLFKHLRILRKQRKNKFPRWKPTRLEGRTMIEERPAIVEKRKRLGDYERDSVLGKRSRAFLLTLIDRTSRYAKISLIPKASSQLVHLATVRCLKNEPIKTITNDNGTEFSRHRETAQALQVPVYFAHAHQAWQRGTNENFNGLVRQYFPKKKDIAGYSTAYVRHVEDLLNNRPRKCLGYKTPLEVHTQLKASVLR